ncbi:MAG: hypothetical protein V3S55_12585 [Nitrospiraceae bacterium]
MGRNPPLSGHPSPRPPAGQRGAPRWEVRAAEEVMEARGVVQGGAHSPREFVVVPMPERAALLAGLPLTV